MCGRVVSTASATMKTTAVFWVIAFIANITLNNEAKCHGQFLPMVVCGKAKEQKHCEKKQINYKDLTVECVYKI